MNAVNPVLAQKIGLTPHAPVRADDVQARQTPMRQMRRALGRAADKAVGLSASVLGIAEEDMDAEAMIENSPDDWVVLGLRDGENAGLTGLFLVDPALRSALMDMQTMGSLLPPSETQRRVTKTDAIMAMPFADLLLKELADVGFGPDGLSPASYDMGPIDDLRTAGLVMTQGVYRCWRITVQLGGGDHQGEMMIAMRPDVATPAEPPKSAPNWAAQLRGALDDAPAELDAELTRIKLSIHKVEAFEVGQVLHLAGTTVGSVTLHGPGGEPVATARLGQIAGKRAVRIQAATQELQDAPIGMAAVAGGHALGGEAPQSGFAAEFENPDDHGTAPDDTANTHRDGTPARGDQDMQALGSPDLIDG